MHNRYGRFAGRPSRVSLVDSLDLIFDWISPQAQSRLSATRTRNSMNRFPEDRALDASDIPQFHGLVVTP